MQIAALESPTHHAPRLGGALPGFGICDGQTSDVDVPVVATTSNVAAARAVWDKLRDAWREDPFIDPKIYLQAFPAIDQNAPDRTSYDRLLDVERRLVDIQYARRA